MARFVYRSAVERELASGPAMAGIVRAVAEEIASGVRAEIPLGPGRYGEHLRESVETSLEETPRGVRARVALGKFTGRFYEFGTSRMRARHPLRSSAERVVGAGNVTEGGR